MCGVFGYIGKRNNASQIVFEGLKELEYRGYDSWGIAALVNSKIFLKKAVGKISGQAPKIKSNICIGHTRWATHGGVSVKNAHPLIDCQKNFALIHNGIIENFDEIKKNLLKKGHIFSSQTDSETTVHLLEENFRKENIIASLLKTFLSLKGFNAFVILNKKKEQIYFFKNGSPLVIGLGEDEYFISSDILPILSYTSKVIYLEDYQGGVLTKDKLILFDFLNNQKIKNPKIFLIPKTYRKEKMGEFSHFMEKEIFEQPKILASILGNSQKEWQKIAEIIKKSYGTYFVGCGSAGHACLIGQYLFTKIAKRHVNFAFGSEFGYLVDFLRKDSLVLALSQSGETIDILEAINRAKEKGVKIAAMVNVFGSTLYRRADYKLMLLAGPEEAVASTKAFLAKIAHLIMVAYSLIGKVNEGKNGIKKAILAITKVLKEKEKIKDIAKKIAIKKDIFIIGRGISYPLALEAALKIKEVSYLHAEGFAAGELKHGVIALIEKGTPCIVFAPNDETYGAVISGAMEVKARGGYIIGISFKNRPEIFDEFFKIEDIGIFSLLPGVVFAQLLAYYLGLLRGCEIDKPRNLAKSVTVR